MNGHPYADPDWDSCALIKIDIQGDTLDGGPFQIPGTTDVLPADGQLFVAHVPRGTCRTQLVSGFLCSDHPTAFQELMSPSALEGVLA